MALRPKTSVLQMRVDPHLLALFQQACDARNWTVSATLRDFMVSEVEAYRIHLVKKEIAARKAQEALEAAGGASVPPQGEKPPVAAPVKSEGPVARRMRLKKEAKLRASVDDDFSDDDDE